MYSGLKSDKIKLFGFCSIFMTGILLGAFLSPGLEETDFRAGSQRLSISLGSLHDSLMGKKYGAEKVPNISYNPQGPLERVYRENISAFVSRANVPKVLVKTNRYGYRGSEYKQRNPEGKKRIVVIGDSFVYGMGVNQSNRFTEILERDLNEPPSEQKYQVINLGVRGAGVENYYHILKQKAVSLNPDTVIISFIGNDRISISEYNEIASNIQNNVGPNVSSDVFKQEYLERRESYIGNEYILLNNMTKISSEQDFEIIYYIAGHMRPKDKSAIRENAGNNTVLESPKEFRDDVSSDFCRSQSAYRVSARDAHPSPKGHQLLARPLRDHIRDREQQGWMPSQGIVQYLNPC